MNDRTIQAREPTFPRLMVTGGDYTYHGYLTTVFRKRRGEHIRAVVEDENGRLFIHNSKQLGLSDGELLEMGVKFHLIVA